MIKKTKTWDNKTLIIINKDLTEGANNKDLQKKTLQKICSNLQNKQILILKFNICCHLALRAN